MVNIFNLDVSGVKKTTDFGYKKQNEPLVIYYRLYRNGYLIDMSTFERLTFRMHGSIDNLMFSEVYTEVVSLNDTEVVKVTLPLQLVDSSEKIFITPVVRLSGRNYNLKEFKLIIYEGNKAEMRAINSAILRFNYMYYLYLDSVKKNQINQPNGVVGLDSDGKIQYSMLPEILGDHVFETIRLNEVHGMRMNERFNLEYFDNDDLEWYEVNSIHGGFFGFPNKPSEYDIFGGTWDDITFLDVDGGQFNDNLSDAYDGGQFNDGATNGIHAGRF